MACPAIRATSSSSDLLQEHETEIRRCLQRGAHSVQIDFTEGRMAMKVDPSGELLHSFIELNNLALARFSPAERAGLGVHTCPGGDRDSTHSADVDYAQLLPSLFELEVGNFFVALAGEKDRPRTLKIIRQHLKPGQRVFVGVVAPIDPRVETAEEVRDRSWRRPNTFRSSSSAPPTTAASRRSATTLRPRARRRSPRSAPGSRARGSPPRPSASG